MVGKVLASWIGNADLRASTNASSENIGPIAQAVRADGYDQVFLLADQDVHQAENFAVWLRRYTSSQVELIPVSLTGPTAFGEIYEAASTLLQRIVTTFGSHDLYLHLSPGTPTMAAVWIILGKTRYPATLIESSAAQGIKVASIPRDISAELLPDLLRSADQKLAEQADRHAALDPAFSEIIQASDVMARLLRRAERCATRNIPVLIEGPSGTGKELLARAIHHSSPRKTHPFIVINCGALPSELVEATLFGHERGAFTGAVAAREGAFELAHGGTLFLDEIGELPLAAQVTLLRVLQDGNVQRVGSLGARRVDVRVVAATNRSLVDHIANGAFREDLFFRLAVAVLALPPIADRGDDLPLLIDSLLDRINRDNIGQPGYVGKRLSPSARKILISHDWPGNVRELNNTLLRAAIWTDGDVLSATDIKDALLMRPASRETTKDFQIGGNESLPEYMGLIARQALESALSATSGNRSKAARLLGLSSRQTFDNWVERYSREVPFAIERKPGTVRA